jgi:hypothetical protein
VALPAVVALAAVAAFSAVAALVARVAFAAEGTVPSFDVHLAGAAAMCRSVATELSGHGDNSVPLVD